MVTTTKSKVAEPGATEVTLKAALAEARGAWANAKRAADSAESAFERLTARRQLPELGAAAEQAEYRLEEFQRDALERERARQAAVRARYDPQIRAALTAALPALEEAERLMGITQALAAEGDRALQDTAGLRGRYAGLLFVPLISDGAADSPLTCWRNYLRGTWLP